MNEIVYSSEAACSRVVERVMRSKNDSVTAIASFLHGNIIEPISKRIFKSGKLQRGVLKPLIRKTLIDLEANETVFDIRLETPHRLSTNEIYHLHFLIAKGEGKEWVHFFSCDIILTRKQVKTAISSANFKIHRHALVRYMQRERKPIGDFLDNVVEPLGISVTVGTAISLTSSEKSNQIAIPMGDGLLLGRCKPVDMTKPSIESTALVMTFDWDDIHHEVEFKETIVKGVCQKVEIMTYVNKDAMTESRQRLHTVLGTLVENHRDGLREIYETTVIRDKFIPKDLDRPQMMQSTIYAACETVRSNVWQRFASSVGREV